MNKEHLNHFHFHHSGPPSWDVAHSAQRRFFSTGSILCQFSSTLMKYWQVGAALHWDGCQRNNEAANKAFHSFPFFLSLWSRLGHCCDERINISFCTLGCFPCSNSHVGASEAADEVGGICGWTQRSCCLAKQEWFVGIQLCNRQYNMQWWRLAVAMYGQHVGWFVRFDSNRFFPLDVDFLSSNDEGSMFSIWLVALLHCQSHHGRIKVFT